MEKCELCLENEATVSAIIDGVYYRNACDLCNSNGGVSSGYARWLRSIDAEDREADIQQPWNSDGTINTRFAKLYPKQAAAVFTPDELDKAMRS